MEPLRQSMALYPPIQQYEKVSFAEYCQRWLISIRPTIKESSYSIYCSQITKHIVPFFSTCCCDTLTDTEIAAFSDFLKENQGLSCKTQKDVLVLLASILKYAGKFDARYLQLQPVYPRIARKEMRVLSRSEQTVFLEYLLQNMDHAKFGVLLALMTGMRIGEICALKWEHISLRDEKILVRSTLQRIQQQDDSDANKTKIVITTPKSQKSIRTIPMSELAVKLCRKMYCPDPETYILTGTKGYMEPRILQYRLRKYTDACHLEGVHFHTLRHTFATRCMEVGMETKVLSDILGHANISITLDCYVHASFDIKKEHIQKLRAVGL